MTSLTSSTTKEPKLYDEHGEINVVSALIKDGSKYELIEDLLTLRDLKSPTVKHIYKTILDLVTSDIMPDAVSIRTELAKNGSLESLSLMVSDDNTRQEPLRGEEVLKYLTNLEIDPNNIESYASQVKDYSGRRGLFVLLQDTYRKLADGLNLDKVLSDLDVGSGKISTNMGLSSKNIKTGKQIAIASLNQFIKASNGEDPYIDTYIDAWDSVVGGLYPGRVYIIAGASNDGKTALALNILSNICIAESNDNLEDEKKRVKYKTLYITMESPDVEITNKLVQLRTGISPMRIERARLLDDEIEQYKQVLDDISNSEIILDDSPELLLATLKNKARREAAAGCKVIIIDQLEQILAGGEKRGEEDYKVLNFITYRLKALARELNVPIILLHQMNRSADSGKNRGRDVEVTNADLAQAGEKAVDAIVMIRHKKKNQKILASYLVWTKNRQSRKGKFPILFTGERILFSNINNADIDMDDISDEDELDW